MNLAINVRKGVMVIFFVAMIMFLVGCSSSDAQEDAAKDAQISQIGEMIEIDDFEITVNYFELADSVSDNLRTFNAEEGNGFVIVDMDIRNMAQESRMLSLIVMHDLNIRLVYDDYFRFNTISLLGYLDGIETRSLGPLVTQNGKMVFRVSDEVLTSENSLYIEFYTEDFMSREVEQIIRVILR